jgi:hypothetical protein
MSTATSPSRAGQTKMIWNRNEAGAINVSWLVIGLFPRNMTDLSISERCRKAFVGEYSKTLAWWTIACSGLHTSGKNPIGLRHREIGKKHLFVENSASVWTRPQCQANSSTFDPHLWTKHTNYS